MGANMARRLKDCGHSITAVYDVNAAGASALAQELGASHARQLAEVTAAADLEAPDVPVVVGEIGRFCAGEALVNAEIRRLPELVPHCALVTSEGLAGRPEQPEVVHFVTPAFRELGRRYAAAWLVLAPPAGPATNGR